MRGDKTMALTKYLREQYKEDVKKRISIPKYFATVIKPELGGYYGDDDYSSDLEEVAVVKCPLHSEETPSFRYYPDTESFYCFGCRRGGDVISLHRYFIESINGQRPPYDASLEYLYKRYVEGRTDATVQQAPAAVPKIMQADAPLSTEVELMLLHKTVRDLEGLMAADRSVPLDRKVKMYGAIDVAQNLTSKNFVPATVAKHWLEHKKREILFGR